MSHFERFLFKGDLTAKNVVKPRAFKPPSDQRLSVLCDEGLSRDEELEIGRCVAQLRNKILVAEGGFFGAHATALGLKTEQVEVPNCYPVNSHWDIIGWPEDEVLRLEIANRLAEVASEDVTLFDE